MPSTSISAIGAASLAILNGLLLPTAVSASKIELVKWDYDSKIAGVDEQACSLYIEDVLGYTGWTRHLHGVYCAASGEVDCSKCSPTTGYTISTSSYGRTREATPDEMIYEFWTRGPFKMIAFTKDKATDDEYANVTVNWAEGSVEYENSRGEKAGCWFPRNSEGYGGGSGYKEWKYEDRLACDPYAEKVEMEDGVLHDPNYSIEIAEAYEKDLEESVWPDWLPKDKIESGEL